MVSDLPLAVFFGDSRARDWPAPECTPFSFLNRGIGGNTVTQVYERIEEQISPLKPAAIILQVGINDLKMIPLSPENREPIVAVCKATTQRIVEALVHLGSIVILTTIFPTGEAPAERVWSDDVSVAVAEVNRYLCSLAGDRVNLLDAHAALLDSDGNIRREYSRDLMHLNQAGYARLNVELAAVLNRVALAPTGQRGFELPAR